MAVVNVAEEVLDGVLQAAEHLKGSVVAAEAGPVESLRWAGALPLLLRDLRVPRIVAADALLACETPAQVRRLLSPLPWEGDNGDDQDEEEEEEEEADDGEVVVDRLVLMVSGFLWDYEPALRRLLATGAIGRLTVCSSLSERAHECYDFSKVGGEAVPAGAKAAKSMAFDAFAAALGEHHGGNKGGTTVKARAVVSPRQERPTGAVKQPQAATNDGNDEDDWDWTDDNDRDDASGAVQAQNPPHSEPWASTSPKLATTLSSSAPSVRVVHLPLNVAPLLSNKILSAEPSLFVLSHPICASAFPLMLHQVQTGHTSGSALPSSSSSAVSSLAPGSDDRAKLYTHVKDVQPEYIPDAFRRSLRLLAHVLGELLSRARLDVKERIFALGATSLKIGHTLVSYFVFVVLVGSLANHAVNQSAPYSCVF